MRQKMLGQIKLIKPNSKLITRQFIKGRETKVPVALVSFNVFLPQSNRFFKSNYRLPKQLGLG